jgi:hypothetical protein
MNRSRTWTLFDLLLGLVLILVMALLATGVLVAGVVMFLLMS